METLVPEVDRLSVEFDGGILRPICFTNDIIKYPFVAEGDIQNDELNAFFQKLAEPEQKYLLSVTYVYELLEKPGEILGLAAILNDSIELPNKVKDKLFPQSRKSKTKGFKRYKTYPATKIGKLCVRSDLNRAGIGTSMILMIKHFFLLRNRTGCRFVTLDAYNKPEVIHFYEKNGFRFLTNDDEKNSNRSMYFDLGIVSEII